jgi:hypothetical protein
MDPSRLSLLDLHARHARHVRTFNQSEKTIDWYRGAIEDFCRFLTAACAVEPPARLADFTLVRVRD